MDLSYDAEVVAVAVTVFKRLGFEKFTVRINNRKILNGLLEEYSLGDKYADILRIMDKMGGVPEDVVLEEFKVIGLDNSQIDRVLGISEFKNLEEKDIFNKLREIQKDSRVLEEGINELETVVEKIKDFGVDERNFKIDLTLARGLDYYTGTVYETILDEYPEIGSVCGGGRYDNLSEYYTKSRYPGVGISIGFTRLFDQLYSRGLINTEKQTPTTVLILSMVDDDRYSYDLAKYLRDNGISTEVFGNGVSVKKQLRYADRLNIPFVIFVGEEEVKNSTYSVKDMRKGEQVSTDMENILNIVK